METLYGNAMTNYELELFRCNRFFKMSEKGDAMTLDDVNKMLNLWFKMYLTNSDLTMNVDRSRHTGVSRACSFEVFGGRKAHNVRLEASKRQNVDKLRELLDRTGIFNDHSCSREFDDDFFWRSVQMPKAIGSEKQASKEEYVMNSGEERLFNVLCENEVSRMDDWENVHS